VGLINLIYKRKIKMGLKKNINKIHSDLSDKFSSVEIVEKYNKKHSNYIEIVVNEENRTMFSIIKKEDLEREEFKWSYKSNPMLEDSYLVERNSSIDKFTSDVKDIFEKDRFDYDYIRDIEKK
jgi:hypothetical protein